MNGQREFLRLESVGELRLNLDVPVCVDNPFITIHDLPTSPKNPAYISNANLSKMMILYLSMYIDMSQYIIWYVFVKYVQKCIVLYVQYWNYSEGYDLFIPSGR